MRDSFIGIPPAPTLVLLLLSLLLSLLSLQIVDWLLFGG
jgi:hypothetical protein